MDNTYLILRNLAKSIRAQNLFTAAKEISSLRLFKNTLNLSQLQELYLSYLYHYDSLNHDIIAEKISKHVLDSTIYEEAYILWKKKNTKKENRADTKQKDVNLVAGKKINFPKR